MKEQDNLSSIASMADEDVAREEQVKSSIPIQRSTYTTDIEDNDTSNDGGSPTIYKGSTTHGVLHAIDTTSTQPVMHVWLGETSKLWPLTVESLRKKNYDTFTFTPFSSRVNWNKANPELKIKATTVLEEVTPSDSNGDVSTKTNSHLMRNNDKFSLIFKLCLFACVAYITALLILFIRYVWAHDGDNLKLRLEIGGSQRMGILLSEFWAGHVSRLSNVGGMIYAIIRGQSQASKEQCDAKRENDNDHVNKIDHEEVDRNIAYDGSDLIEWIKSNGGFIHPNARIGLDPTGSYRGVFVKSVEEGGTPEGIEEDTIICKIPWDLIVKPPNYDYNDYGTNCDAFREIYHQFQLGDESKYAPYINYLKNQPNGRIPSEWSKSGKKLLTKILDQDNIGLPPFNALDRFEEIWVEECDLEDTPLARSAFFQFTSRDEDNLMVPFFDMHNHSNDPKKLNTVPFKPVRAGQPFTMQATRDIAPGEQIIISYNRCHGCWFDEEYEECDTKSYRGTDFLFSQFGFVEDYPQFWNIPQFDEDGGLYDSIIVCLDRDDQGELFVRRFGENDSPEEEEVPINENLIWMNEHSLRLKELKDSLKNDGALNKSMPSYEWETAWAYHDAVFNVLSIAIEEVTGGTPNDESKDMSSEDASQEDDEGEEMETAFVDNSEDGSSEDTGGGSSGDDEPDFALGGLVDDNSSEDDPEYSSSDDDDDEVEEEVMKEEVAGSFRERRTAILMKRVQASEL